MGALEAIAIHIGLWLIENMPSWALRLLYPQNKLQEIIEKKLEIKQYIPAETGNAARFDLRQGGPQAIRNVTFRIQNDSYLPVRVMALYGKLLLGDSAVLKHDVCLRANVTVERNTHFDLTVGVDLSESQAEKIKSEMRTATEFACALIGHAECDIMGTKVLKQIEETILANR